MSNPSYEVHRRVYVPLLIHPPELPPPLVEPAVPYLATPPVERLTVPVYPNVPTFDELLPFLFKSIISARRIPSYATSTWKEATQTLWSRELARLALVFDDALRNPTPINLFNAVFSFICSPGTVLGPCFKAPSTSRADNSGCPVSSALHKIMRGQERKASKVLSSFGVAKITPAVISALRHLHPERKSDLILPSTVHPQLSADPAAVADNLFTKCGDRNVSKDVYGWAPWLFFSCRGEKNGFFQSLVNFCCFLTDNPSLFPSTCALLLSGGALTPLHKLNPEERKLREDTHLPPKLRPINSGSLIAKVVLSAVIRSPAGQRAAERVAPFQLSLGVSRGAEKLIHICRAAHESKWLVGKNDYENGFNSLSRQQMLNNHSSLFPESTAHFQFLLQR